MPWTIIDSDDYAASGIETLVFPGGEPHVKVDAQALHSNVLMVLKCRTWADTGFAALALDAVVHRGDAYKTVAFIPYFPGARMDRQVKGHPFTLRTMGRLFDVTGAAITTFDAHSSQLAYWVRNRTMNFMPSSFNGLMPKRENVAGIISPDSGALGRAMMYRNKFYPNADIIHCEKSRDPDTGALSGYKMEKLKKIGHYIIVDDICDAGGTFNLLVQEFVKDNLAFESTLELFVSHGIFSKGIDNLHARIERITTTDSFCQMEDTPRLTVLPLKALYREITGDRTLNP